MWEHTLATTTDVSAEELWAVVADITNWPAWQPGVELAQVTPDGRSVMVRESGRRVRLTIQKARPAYRIVVCASLFLARTRTEYEFRAVAGGTRITVAVQLHGPLRFLYSWALGARLERGLPAMVRQMIGRARVSADGVGVGRLVGRHEPNHETFTGDPVPAGV